MSFGAPPPSGWRPRLSIETIAAILATVALFVLYTATAAPDLTFWDAPELVTALHRFGIPHPPGTPLYVTIGRTVHLLFDAAGPPRAATMVSVTAGALTGGATAWLVARWIGALVPALAAALMSGAMFSVWRNATETEVYALALLLAVLLLVIADQARAVGRRGEDPARWLLLLAYASALAVPLHTSALVSLPAAVLWAWPALLQSWRAAAGRRWRTMIWLGGAGLLGTTALTILPVRATMDPALNEGNARTFAAWIDVVQRTQYHVAGLLPRRAPLWLQLGNVFEWADWQVARQLGPSPVPTVGRTGVTLVAVILALIGLAPRHGGDRMRSWLLAVALASGTWGVAVRLNLLPGPSFGAGIVAVGALHEARERDYFFVVGWWAWGVLIALGAWSVARRLTRRLAAPAGPRVAAGLTLLLALAPAVLNYGAVDRTHEPESSLPRVLGLELLEATPPNGVLLLAGDLDGFPVWYLQAVEQRRLDVTPVIVPLLGASWYRDELARRARLELSGATGEATRQAALARRRRPVASPLLTADQRGRPGWVYTGVVFEWEGASAGDLVDLPRVRRQRARVAPSWLAPLGPSADPAGRLAQRVLGCAAALDRATLPIGSASVVTLLERVCELP